MMPQSRRQAPTGATPLRLHDLDSYSCPRNEGDTMWAFPGRLETQFSSDQLRGQFILCRDVSMIPKDWTLQSMHGGSLEPARRCTWPDAGTFPLGPSSG